MIAVSKLYNDIKGAVLSVGGMLGLIDAKAFYPNDIGIHKTNFVPENWAKLPFPYTFSVVHLLGGVVEGFKDFELPLAPSEITQSEEPAISIKTTQGGTIVSHGGNRYKTLTLSGTTGISPFRGAGGTDQYTGQVILQNPNNLKYKSGYEVFHELRNYFKAYLQIKKDRAFDTNVRNYRLLFKNYKDGEFLIVELLKFDMKRSAGRSYLYDYNISFKVIRPFAFKNQELSFPESWERVANIALSKINTARGIFLQSSAILKQIEATYDSTVLEPVRQIGLALRAANGVGYSAADLPKNIARATINNEATYALMTKLRDDQKTAKNESVESDKNRILVDVKIPSDLVSAAKAKGVNLLLDLGEASTTITSSDLPETSQNQLEVEAGKALELPRTYYETTLADLARINKNAEDSFNLGSTYYDGLFNRTSTIVVNPNRVATDAEFEVLYGFGLVKDAVLSILSTTKLFKVQLDQQIQSIIADFDAGELPLENTNAVIQIVLPASTDLERLALKYLGDSNRWVEIAELNGLEAPYIDQDVNTLLDNVKIPGDTLLIPSPVVFGFGKLAEPSKDITSTVGLSYLEKSLGTDLMLTDEMDIAVNNTGDIEVISGIENMAQAVILKLSYEKGDLIRHPEIGSGLVIGSKVRSLSEVKEDVTRTLLMDPRVEKLSNIAILQEGGACSLTFELKIKNIDTPVPISIGL